VRLAHFRPGKSQRLEGLEVGLGLARQPDLGEDGDAIAQRLGIDVGMIAPDEAGLFESADPPEARRRRYPGATRQVDIGHSSIGLQVAQDSAIDLVELDAAHPISLETCASRGNARPPSGASAICGSPWYYTVIILQVVAGEAASLPGRARQGYHRGGVSRGEAVA
jgi:hypothetical protein